MAGIALDQSPHITYMIDNLMQMTSATSKRRQGPLRQLSLQSPQHVTSRGPFRKQLSEDGSQSNHLIPCWSDSKDVTSLRVGSNSAKTSGSQPQNNQRHVIVGRTGGGGHSGRPRPIKVAWAEVKHQSQEFSGSGVEVIARKCSGQPRPGTAKPHQKPHLPSIGDKDTILYSRQQLAERLRKVWKEREQSRNNIDIFLAHNSGDSGVCDDESTLESGTSKSILKAEETFDVGVLSQSPISVVTTVLDSKPYIHPHDPEKEDVTLVGGDTLHPSNNARIIEQSSSETLFTAVGNKSQQVKSLYDKKPYTFNDRSSFKQTACKDDQEDVTIVLNASAKYETLSQRNMIPQLGPEHKTLQQKTNVNFVHSVFSVNSNTMIIPADKTVVNEKLSDQNVYSCSPKLSLGGGKSCENALKYDDIDESMVAESSVEVSQEVGEIQLDVDSIIDMEISTSERQSLSLSSQEDSSSLESDLPESEAMGEDLNPPKSEVVDKVELELSKPTVFNASTRRVIFRNSVNKAITSSFSSEMLPTSQKETNSIRDKPAPLCRALSAPPQKLVPNARSILVRKPTLQTSFSVELAVKDDTVTPGRLERQTKSAPPRRPKLKTTRRRGKSHDDDASDDEDRQAKEKTAAPKGRKALGRGAEVVTMVSLMSPNGSDNEENEVESSEFLPTPADHIAPWFEDTNDVRKEVQKTQPAAVTTLAPRIVCLRKSPKTVSFQNQPSLAGGRSYSTLFPVRRGSVMGTALSPTPLVSAPSPVEREKRLQVLDTSGARRRLVRPNYPAQNHTRVESSTDPSDVETPSVGPNIAEQPITADAGDVTPSRAPSASVVDVSRPSDTLNTEEASEEPVFQNPKEKECWKLYKKMSEKGVSVSYETVLRGMLTPTEYRLRKKALLT